MQRVETEPPTPNIFQSTGNLIGSMPGKPKRNCVLEGAREIMGGAL